MNILETMKQALEALETDSIPRSEFDSVVANLKSLIAEIEKAEPFGWAIYKDDELYRMDVRPDDFRVCKPLFLHPPLSDEPVGWKDVAVERPKHGQHIIGCDKDCNTWDEVWDKDEPIGGTRWWIPVPRKDQPCST